MAAAISHHGHALTGLDPLGLSHAREDEHCQPQIFADGGCHASELLQA